MRLTQRQKSMYTRIVEDIKPTQPSLGRRLRERYIKVTVSTQVTLDNEANKIRNKAK